MRKPKLDARLDRNTNEPYYKITRAGTSAFLLMNPDELVELHKQIVAALGANNGHTTA